MSKSQWFTSDFENLIQSGSSLKEHFWGRKPLLWKGICLLFISIKSQTSASTAWRNGAALPNSFFSYTCHGDNQLWVEEVSASWFGDSGAVAPAWCQGCWPEGPGKHRAPPGVLSGSKTPSRTASRSRLCNGGETTWKIIMRFNLTGKIFFTFRKVQVPAQLMTFKIYGGKYSSADDH